MKAKTWVTKVRQKIESEMDDFSHKLSGNLVENRDPIAFEYQNINGMVGSHHLAKSAGNAGRNRIIQNTSHKAESACTLTVLIDLNVSINKERKGMEKIKEIKDAWMPTHELTPAEIRAVRAVVNAVAQTESPFL